MRPFVAMLVYFFMVFIGGALLAPWLFKLAQASVPQLVKSEFHFYVQNSLLVMALIGAWPLLRSQGVTSPRDIGLVNPAREGNKILGGFLLGFISLTVVATIVVAAGARNFRNDLLFSRVLEKLGGIFLTATGVALLEEILFRGVIFGSLRKIFDWRFALILSSALYAIMHFLAEGHHEGDVAWYSGLQLLPQMLVGFTDLNALVPAFFNLLLAGTLLGLAYQRTGTLWFSIGIHAGWIFWVKTYMTFTKDAHGPATWFFGTNKMVNGWLALLVLTGTLLIFTRLPVARKREDFRW